MPEQPSTLEHDVTELGPAPGRAAVRAAAEDQTAADARADGEDDEIVDADSGARAVLADCRGVAVVLDDHGDAELILEHRLQPNSLERQVAAPDERRRAAVDRRGARDAHRRRLFRHLADRMHQEREQLVAAEAARGHRRAGGDGVVLVHYPAEQLALPEVHGNDARQRRLP